MHYRIIVLRRVVFIEPVCVLRALWGFLASISVLSCSAKIETEPRGYDIIDDISNNIDDLKDTLVIGQWNIGHFSGGSSPNSTIRGKEYTALVAQCRSIISSLSADIISLNEFSVVIGTDNSNIQYKAEDELFQDYDFRYIGHQSRYSCNALFSKVELLDCNEQVYECNQTAQITHTSVIKATDYYLVESIILLKGVKTVFVSTHLAFDKNNEDVACNQIRELIEKYKDEEHIFICGDWNIFDVHNFNLFTEAGYQIANHSKYGDFDTWDGGAVLDNIIVKGYDIVDVKMINTATSISDHNPIVVKFLL